MNTETEIKQISCQRILDMWNKQRMTIFEKDAEIQKLQEKLDWIQEQFAILLTGDQHRFSNTDINDWQNSIIGQSADKKNK